MRIDGVEEINTRLLESSLCFIMLFLFLPIVFSPTNYINNLTSIGFLARFDECLAASPPNDRDSPLAAT